MDEDWFRYAFEAFIVSVLGMAGWNWVEPDLSASDIFRIVKQ